MRKDRVTDTSKPDGSLRKLMNSQLINNLGWQAQTSLKDGLIKNYNYFLKFNANI